MKAHETTGFAIRKACIADAPSISHVIVQGWKSAYRGIVDDAYLDALDETDPKRLERLQTDIALGKILVAADGKQVVGIAIFGHSREKGFAGCSEVYALYVLDEYQGSGIGKRLVVAAQHEIAAEGFNRFIIVCLSGNPSCRFYEHIGGVEAGKMHSPVGGKEYAETVFEFEARGAAAEE